MSRLSYETVATFAQQAGTLYFGAVFLAGVIYALWPGRKAVFDRAAQLPLEDDEIDHV
jgi:cytochrome c oxidase cbb3-type subunit IV